MVPSSKVLSVGAGTTVKSMFPLCEREPLVASTVIEEVVGLAEAETLKVRVWLAPGETEKGDAGEGAIPGGTFCNCNWTTLLSPFFAITAMETGVVVPPTPTETEEGENRNTEIRIRRSSRRRHIASAGDQKESHIGQ
jgi:hypothetical protein